MSSKVSAAISKGENKAWDILRTLSPEDVCRRASVQYAKASSLYVVRSLGMDFNVIPRERRISSTSANGELFLERLEYFFGLSILWYLVSAKDAPLTGKLVKLEDMKDGQFFAGGSHTLPLSRLASRYGNDKEGFIMKGKEFGAEELDYGDASIRLFAFPRVPVVMILWVGDEEFPHQVNLLFDSSCEEHTPIDVTWSIAMMSTLALF